MSAVDRTIGRHQSPQKVLRKSSEALLEFRESHICNVFSHLYHAHNIMLA